jgi:hypothetical protein
MIRVVLLAALWAGALAAAPPPPQSPAVGPRIAAALAAEQSLQGPLDGEWRLGDAAGRVLYRLQFVDPAGRRGPLTGAWLEPRRGTSGFIAAIRWTGRLLRLDLVSGGGPAVSVSLRERRSGLWTGWMTAGGARRPVVLRRRQGFRAG